MGLEVMPRKNVLIVDDDWLLRDVLRRTLARVGCASWQFTEAATADAMLLRMGFLQPAAGQGWAVSRGARFDCGQDIIVLDENMPDSISGTAAMRVLRDNEIPTGL